MIIEDGKGTGKKTEVSEDNRLNVSAKSNGRMYYVSRDDEKAFAVNLEIAQIVGGATENLGYIQYTGNGHVHIHSITFSTEEPATGLTKFGIWIGQTVSGCNAKTPTNLNLSSAIESESTCCHGPGLTFSGGSSLGTVRFSGAGTFERNYDDTIILSYNSVITIKASAATAGTKVIATILFWEH